MRYLPHTPAEIAEMLRVVGAPSVDALFQSIPTEARFEGALSVPEPLDEPALMAHLAGLAAQNTGARCLSFLGGGMALHHLPPALDQLLLRSEFLTAYTPYQPEVAQGTLQAIWEFQTIVSELFGLPLANASLYDGANGVAEAALMAMRLVKRPKVLLSDCVHPQAREVTATYLAGRDDARLCTVPVAATGGFDLAALSSELDEETAAVIVGYPSFFGAVTDLRPLAERVHAAGALLVAAVGDPYALGVLESPGAMGADIAVAEGQPLACAPQFGGPGVGLFACRDERRFLQQLPGRVCGQSVDSAGETGYVLTLSTREQHIRRERATSNICSNQALIALALTIRTTLLGRTGFIEAAEQCAAKAHYLEERILGLSGYARGFEGSRCFNEFAVRVRGGNAAAVCAKLEQQGILAGLDLGRISPALADRLLIAVTELHRREDLDRLVAALDAV